MVSEMSWRTAWMRSKNRPLLFVIDVLGATPEPWQAAVLEAVGKHDRVSITSGHGVGKTTLEAWLVLWFCSPGRTARSRSLRTRRISSGIHLA
jgi:hypothetical protein